MDATTTNQRIADTLIKETDADGDIDLRDGVRLLTADEYENETAWSGSSDGSPYWLTTDDGHTTPIADSSDLADELTRIDYSLLDAARYFQPETVKILLEEGADINQSDRKGFTPLMLANRNPGITQILCDARADVNAQDGVGWTALHHGAQVNDEETIQILLDAGADATIVNKKGETYLGYFTRPDA